MAPIASKRRFRNPRLPAGPRSPASGVSSMRWLSQMFKT